MLTLADNIQMLTPYMRKTTTTFNGSFTKEFKLIFCASSLTNYIHFKLFNVSFDPQSESNVVLQCV